VEESRESYRWILESQHEMEPCWSPSILRIFFDDHKVTPSLMTSLEIQETCLLRGDYYNNMSEVFPKKIGEHFFAIIKAYLKAMLESKIEEEWMSAYGQAKQHVCFRPDKFELLLDGFMKIQVIILGTSCTTIQEVSIWSRVLQQNKIAPLLLLIFVMGLFEPSWKTLPSY
jgi:hypothetical protein